MTPQNTQVLNDMEQSEAALTESLKGQLDKVNKQTIGTAATCVFDAHIIVPQIRREKSRLETELDDRAKLFEASLHKLQARARYSF
jgi:hypothetical protein